MYAVVKKVGGKWKCPYCDRKFWSPFDIEAHFDEIHSVGHRYKIVLASLPTNRGNYRFSVSGPCACGCDNEVTYPKDYWVPNKMPMYIRNHEKFGMKPNAGSFKPGHVPWNTGTVGLSQPNSGSFKKGHVPHQDRGGIRQDPNGQFYVWTGERHSYGVRKYKARSRIVMEGILQRELTRLQKEV